MTIPAIWIPLADVDTFSKGEACMLANVVRLGDVVFHQVCFVQTKPAHCQNINL